MKLLGIALLNTNTAAEDAIMLVQASELSAFGYFQRGSVGEMITFFSKTIAKRTPPGQRQSVQNQEYFVHVYLRGDGLCGCITADTEYPARVAFSLIAKLMDDFSIAFPQWAAAPEYSLVWPPMDEAVVKFQDPAAADQIMRIQKNLDETRDVLHNTIDSVLQRGEKLEDLVERSGELSGQSKLFYKNAKRANSCCAVA
jgi:synaptobrevin family protein YKT6